MNTIECNKSKEYYTFSSHRHPDAWEISLNYLKYRAEFLQKKKKIIKKLPIQ